MTSPASGASGAADLPDYAPVPRSALSYPWAHFICGHLGRLATAPIIAKYTGVLAAADIDIFTTTTTFAIMQSLRLDRGLSVSGPVHP